MKVPIKNAGFPTLTSFSCLNILAEEFNVVTTETAEYWYFTALGGSVDIIKQFGCLYMLSDQIYFYGPKCPFCKRRGKHHLERRHWTSMYLCKKHKFFEMCISKKFVYTSSS